MAKCVCRCFFLKNGFIKKKIPLTNKFNLENEGKNASHHPHLLQITNIPQKGGVRRQCELFINDLKHLILS